MERYEKFLKTGQQSRMLDTDNPNWMKRQMFNWYFKNKHSGQVVTQEEAEMIDRLCNCDYPYCTTVRFRRNTNLAQSLFKSHYLAKINQQKCTQCKKCISICQFGALNYSASTNTVQINETSCFGCGICRNRYDKNAITLENRN
jgi:MinD superfamily P-loop ATPase